MPWHALIALPVDVPGWSGWARGGAWVVGGALVVIALYASWSEQQKVRRDADVRRDRA